MKKSELKELIKEVILNESEDIMKLPKDEQAKIIAQFEAIRLLVFDIYDLSSVQRTAYKKGYYELVNFTANDRKAYSSILKNYGTLIKMVNSAPEYRKLRIKYNIESKQNKKTSINEITYTEAVRLQKELD